jgi:hypothetical protein
VNLSVVSTLYKIGAWTYCGAIRVISKSRRLRPTYCFFKTPESRPTGAVLLSKAPKRREPRRPYSYSPPSFGLRAGRRCNPGLFKCLRRQPSCLSEASKEKERPLARWEGGTTE